MRILATARESVKGLLRPYPALYGAARRVHRRLYQRSVLLSLRIRTLVKRPRYERRYRAFWEERGLRMMECERACEDPAGWRGGEKRLVADQIARLTPTRVLELGCGYGRVLRSLAEQPSGAFICGCDISLTSLRNCQDYLSDPSIPLLQADGRFGLPFKDDAFDVVFTCGVMNSIPPPADEAVRKELLRVASAFVVHCESTGPGTYHFGHDNAAAYRSMGCTVEELPYPLEQNFLNPKQFILVHACRTSYPSRDAAGP